MSIKLKLSIFFLLSALIIRIVGPIMVNHLKSWHLKRNPILVEKYSVVFKIADFLFKFAALLFLIYIVAIWTGFVTIPPK